MEGIVRSIEGKEIKKISLPEIFSTPFRPDIIRRAVVAAQSRRRQPYGPGPMSGMRHSVATWGKGRGSARVQRLKGGSTAAESPNNVGGRRAHPPRPYRDYSKLMNKKEGKIAVSSAIAATADIELVRKRNHKFDETSFPIIVEDAFEGILTTKEALNVLASLGLKNDIERAKLGKHIRAGKGKARGRKYRVPTSVLVVCKDSGNLYNSLKNLPGVNVREARNISAEDVAPGGDPGRLTVYTESAIRYMAGDE